MSSPTQLVLTGLAVILLLSYIIWSYRPPRPDLLVYRCRGTDCEIDWSCPTEQEQYKCHLLPPAIAKKLPIKHYLIEAKKGGEDQWRTVGIRQHGEPQKYCVPNLHIGSHLQFRVVTVNVLGRRSFPSEVSSVFRVVDKPLPPGTPWVEDVMQDEASAALDSLGFASNESLLHLLPKKMIGETDEGVAIHNVQATRPLNVVNTDLATHWL